MRDPLQKGLLHMGSDSIRSILLQTPTALLVVEEQVSNTRAIHLHMFQLSKNWIALEYVHDHPCIPRECGRVGLTRVISHRHLQHQGVFFCRGLPHPFPDVCQCIRQPLRENHGASSNGMYSPWSSGEYISPKSLRLSGSITVVQQLAIVTQKYNLQPLGYSLYMLWITLRGTEWSLNKVLKKQMLYAATSVEVSDSILK